MLHSKAPVKKSFTPEPVPGAYLHFPFCEAKCHYCDFFSFAESKFSVNERHDIYQDIRKEAELLAGHGSFTDLKTVFLGGGTPSLVPEAHLSTVLNPLNLTRVNEVTIEANPSSVTTAKAALWRKLGINRVSMGVQALDDQRLKWLDRVHDSAAAFTALGCLAEAGFTNVSVDYILGVPDQNEAIIGQELKRLAAHPVVKHISAYLLTLHKSNPKFKALPNEETQLAHLFAAHNTLTNLGFEHYEISNYARPGYRAQHNENYWLGQGYAAIGPSAHGYYPTQKLRAKNWSNLERYSSDVVSGVWPQEWTETIDPNMAQIEFIMLRLRRSDGFDVTEYDGLFGGDFLASKKGAIEGLLKHGLMALGSNRLKLTTRGLFLSDQIFSQLI